MRIKRSFLILMIIPLLTGCWSRKEINDMSIVVGVAVDKADNNNIQLSLQIANPRSLGGAGAAQGAGGKKSTILISATAETIMDAYRIIQTKLPREVFFAHTRVILIGEELAKDDVAPVLDFFSRSRQVHLRSFVLITKGRAIEMLKLNPRLEPILVEEIREQEKTKVGMHIRVRDFLKNLLTEGEEPVAAKISIKPLEDPEDAGNSVKTPAIDGAAVFRRGKLIGWMSNKEARGVLWLRDEMNTGVMSVIIPVKKGGGKIAAYLLSGTTKIKPIIRNGELIIKVEVSGDIAISENTSRLDLTDPKILTSVGRLFEKDIEDRIRLSIEVVQNDFNSDIFGFGQAVYRAYPNRWQSTYKQRWSEIFPKLAVEISTQIVVKSTGYSTKSMTITETDY